MLIDYDRLQGLLGAGSDDQLRSSHKGWVAECCGDVENVRKDEWTGSIAVGSKAFVEMVKALLGFRSDLQLYLDLYHYPLRGREQAEHLYKRRLKKQFEGYGEIIKEIRDVLDGGCRLSYNRTVN